MGKGLTLSRKWGERVRIVTPEGDCIVTVWDDGKRGCKVTVDAPAQYYVGREAADDTVRRAKGVRR